MGISTHTFFFRRYSVFDTQINDNIKDLIAASALGKKA